MDDIEKKTGLGCGGGCGGGGGSSPGPNRGMEHEVYRYIRAGSPRLALASAMCVPFQPTLYNVRATFPSTSTVDVPDVGADDKFSQDTDIEGLVIRTVNASTTANSNPLQTLSDFFYNFQSGIAAKLQVLGAPKYSVASRFTPLSTLADVIGQGCSGAWPHGWILGLGQQLLMDFHAYVPVPVAPVQIICTFRGRIPTTDAFNAQNMSSREAIEGLRKLGFCIPPGYENTTCR